MAQQSREDQGVLAACSRYGPWWVWLIVSGVVAALFAIEFGAASIALWGACWVFVGLGAWLRRGAQERAAAAESAAATAHAGEVAALLRREEQVVDQIVRKYANRDEYEHDAHRLLGLGFQVQATKEFKVPGATELGHSVLYRRSDGATSLKR